MKRDVAQLADQTFDVLVIGAGIHGACIAREASLRGLSVALVDRSDFGAATSANSLKIIHGGLRYLQSINFRRMRESVREQQTLFRIAPHLVRPLPFVIPTFGSGRRSKFALQFGLTATRLIAPPNHRAVGHQSWPKGRTLSCDQLADLFPKLAGQPHISGGALWYDGQVDHTERLTLAFVRSAVERGCVAANYVEVTKLIQSHNRIVGATLADRLDGGSFNVRASLTINAVGPWVEKILTGSQISTGGPPGLAKAWNVITRMVHPTHAVGVQCDAGGLESGKRGRMLFATPWRGKTVIGTMYAPAGSADDQIATAQEVKRLIDAFNTGLPDAQLSAEDVSLSHVGVLPTSGDGQRSNGVTLADRHKVIDHFLKDRLAGLISVVGVKYTTARLVAEQVVTLAANKLSRRLNNVDTARVPVDGGDMDSADRFTWELEQTSPAGTAERVGRLVGHYGCRTAQLLDLCRGDAGLGEPITDTVKVIRAEVRYACSEEMAVRLLDLLARRTDLGIAGCPSEATMLTCSRLMADELGWADGRIAEELDEARDYYSQRVAMASPPKRCVF